jgi:hypothetical protein
MQYLDLKSNDLPLKISAAEKTVHYNDISRSFQPILQFHRLRLIYRHSSV